MAGLKKLTHTSQTVTMKTIVGTYVKTIKYAYYTYILLSPNAKYAYYIYYILCVLYVKNTLAIEHVIYVKRYFIAALVIVDSNKSLKS